MSDKEKSKGKVWFVRGVPIELRDEVAAAAERAGMNIGPWVVRALRAALERPEAQGAPSGPGGAGDLAGQVAELVERVEHLEAALPSRQKPVDAVKPAGGAEMPETPEAPGRAYGGANEGKQTRQKWTVADDDVLRRIAAEGGTQANAARELGRPSSVVNGKWKALGLPVLPRKGRKLKR